MNCVATHDTNRYEREIDQDEALEDAKWEWAVDIRNEWCEELNKTGYIERLDMTHEDIDIAMDEQKTDSKGVLDKEAYALVDRNINDYLSI